MVSCAKCNYWFKISGSVEGKCRCKQSENWNKNVLYCSTCDKSKEIVMPTFLGDVVKCKACGGIN